MDTVLRYRGREVAAADVTFIRDLIARHPGQSRRWLSQELCRAWDWRQQNGVLRDMVCRGLMLELHRADHITLPPVRVRPHNPLVTRKRKAPVAEDRTPIQARLSDLRPLTFVQVRRTSDEARFDGLIEEHHYLGGRMARRVSRDWQDLYGHPILYLESFVDPARFAGTCYRAANWHFLGRTTGRGKDDQTRRANRSLKEVLGLPLTKRFRESLGHVR